MCGLSPPTMWISVKPVSSCCRTASSTSCSGVYVYASACFCVTANAQNLHFTRQTFVWFKYRFWTKKTRSSPPRRRRDAQERALEVWSAGQRGAHSLVALGREQQRQRRRALTEVGPCDLPRLDGHSRAVQDVVGDLERDAECEPECARAAREATSGLEELPGLERAALEVGVHGGVGIEALTALHRLAAREAQRRVGEHRKRSGVPGPRELGERACEQVVAGRARRGRPVRRPG